MHHSLLFIEQIVMPKHIFYLLKMSIGTLRISLFHVVIGQLTPDGQKNEKDLSNPL